MGRRQHPSSVAEALALRYVALGDSYTIGTGVRPPERWPDQLCAALGDEPGLELVANLGVNGYNSADLIRLELPRLEALAPEFASVLIGVNDVVQGIATARYATNVAVILEALLERLPAERLIAVAIPDYTVTPAGAEFGDPRLRHAAIVTANAVMAEQAGARGIGWVDIFDLSRRAADDWSLVASDGLHPSGAQYALWVERIAPVVEGRLAH
jgi:lysophospholipase L1-like esterase